MRYRGAPADRFWAFEDATVNLAALDAAPDDLGRLALVEFATVFGNDWYVVPVDSPYGTLNEIVSVVVRDTFGESLLLRHTSQASAGRFRMYDVGHTAPLLFLPPVVAYALEGAPVEEVLFLRDEMANLAWAVERVVEGVDGRGHRRTEEPPPAPDPPAGPAGLRYVAQTPVPAYWIPFLPVHDESRRGVRLHRGAMLAYGDGLPTPVVPLGQVLEPDRPLVLHEEEIPRSGVRVSRVPALCRWVDGDVYAWTGRRVSAGRGEGASGLSFDVVGTENPLRSG